MLGDVISVCEGGRSVCGEGLGSHDGKVIGMRGGGMEGYDARRVSSFSFCLMQNNQYGTVEKHFAQFLLPKF